MILLYQESSISGAAGSWIPTVSGAPSFNILLLFDQEIIQAPELIHGELQQHTLKCRLFKDRLW
jgi:hypothetical protein